MKSNNRLRLITLGCQILLVAFIVVLISSTKPVSCRAIQTAILLWQSPTQGGNINLGEGVHHFEQYTEITLTAIPKSGWEFVCWLGEVSDATTPTTTAFIDAPKIIIAVFERVAFEFLIAEIGAQSSPGQNLLSGAEYARRGGAGEGPPPPPPPPPPPTTSTTATSSSAIGIPHPVCGAGIPYPTSGAGNRLIVGAGQFSLRQRQDKEINNMFIID